MVKLSKITDFLKNKFPLSYAEEYDNPGLLAGRSEKDIQKALVCLDCTTDVVEEAVRKNADLIICHHPVIFNPIKSVTDFSDNGKILLTAIENHISIYSAHTNLDSAPGGLTDYIASKLCLKVLSDMDNGLGRICCAEGGIAASGLCKRLKEAFGIAKIYTTLKSDKTLYKIAIVNGGGGGELVQIAKKCGADVYISGDLKHHEHLELSETNGCSFIEIRHHDFEFIMTELVSDLLKKEFPSLDTEISKCDVSPLIDSDLM